MRYKKFLIIPVLLFLYIFFAVDFLVNFNPALYSYITIYPEGGAAGQPIFIGSASLHYLKSKFKSTVKEMEKLERMKERLEKK